VAKKIAQRMKKAKNQRSYRQRGNLNSLRLLYKAPASADYRGLPNITPMDQELIRSLEEKAGKPALKRISGLVTFVNT